MSEVEDYQGILKFKIQQLDRHNNIEREYNPDYLNLTVAQIDDLITNPSRIYSADNGLISNWINDSDYAGKYFLPAPHDGRLFVNKTGNYVKCVFKDGPVSISSVIFVYINEASQTGWDRFVENREPFDIQLMVYRGDQKNDDGTTTRLEGQVLPTHRRSSIHGYPQDRYRFISQVNPYLIEDLPDRYKRDAFQVNIHSGEISDGKPFMHHDVKELIFKMDTDNPDASDYSLLRIFVFGANSTVCKLDEATASLADPFNSTLFGPGIPPGGPFSCVDDSYVEDSSRSHIYYYTPIDQPQLYDQYLTSSHNNDLFSVPTILSVKDVLGNDVPLNEDDLNLPYPTTRRIISIVPSDIYQVNVELSSFVRRSNGDIYTVCIKLENDRSSKTYYIPPAPFETSQAIRRRIRGVASKYFPGFPWSDIKNTCLMKDCHTVTLFGIQEGEPWTTSPILNSFLIRTLNPLVLCNPVLDESLIVPSPYPNQNDLPVIIADWGGTSVTWDETLQTWKCSHFGAPAYNPSTTYPFYDGREKEYAILDKEYSRYFTSRQSGSFDITRICDGYLHVDDFFQNPNNIVDFSTPVDIYHMRIFFLLPVVVPCDVTISVVTSDGVHHITRNLQTDDALMNTYNNTKVFPSLLNVRTHPWDLPPSTSLFGNVVSLTISTSNKIAGLQVWGAYLK